MDFTLMIIARFGNGDGSSATSQLKSFPTQVEADRVADSIPTQVSEWAEQYRHIPATFVLKLY